MDDMTDDPDVSEANRGLRMSAPCLPLDIRRPAQKHRYFSVLRALEKLNPEFRYNELMEALVSEGMSQSFAKRARIRLLKMQVIVKEGDKYRFVRRKWRGIFDREEGELGTR